MPGSDSATLTTETRRREAALLSGNLLDLAISIAMAVVAVWSNSLSLLADLLRGTPQMAIGFVLYGLMRRIHRGRLTEYDYGTRKVEQFANLVAGSVLILAALWLVLRMLARHALPEEQPALGLLAALGVGLLNFAINVGVLLALWRAARGGGSLILRGQVLTRLSMTIASGCVAVAIAVNTVLAGSFAGVLADLAGTAVVVVMMLGFGGRLVGEAVPHLLDRALGERHQVLVNKALVERFEGYDGLVAVRTRTEGLLPWVEVELAFAPDRPVGEATAEADRLADAVRAQIPDARVLVVIRSAPRPAVPVLEAASARG
jgi:divalent metal cation (Fe/Co/Zn/Cd) transporter